MKTLILSIIFLAFPISLMSQLSWRKVDDIPHFYNHDFLIRLSNEDILVHDFSPRLGFRKSTDDGKTWETKNILKRSKDSISLLSSSYSFETFTENSRGTFIAQQDTYWLYSTNYGDTWEKEYCKFGACDILTYQDQIICITKNWRRKKALRLDLEKFEFSNMGLPDLVSYNTCATIFQNFLLVNTLVSHDGGDTIYVKNLETDEVQYYDSPDRDLKDIFVDSNEVYFFYPEKTYVSKDTCKTWELYQEYGYEKLNLGNSIGVKTRFDDLSNVKQFGKRLFFAGEYSLVVTKDFGKTWDYFDIRDKTIHLNSKYPYIIDGLKYYEYSTDIENFVFTGDFKLSYTTHYREFGDTLVSENKIKYPGKEWEDLNLKSLLGFNKERYVIENQNILKYTLDNPQPKLLGTLNFKPKSDKIELRPSVNNNKLQSFPLIESESGFGRGTSIPPNGVAYIHIITPDTLLKTYQYKPGYRVNVDDFEIDINGTALFNQYNSEEEAYEICAVNLNTQEKLIGFRQTYDEAIYIHANDIKVEGDVICFNYRYTDRDYGHHEVPKFSLNGGETWQTLGSYKLDVIDFEIYDGVIYISGYNGVYKRENDDSYTNLMDNVDISDFFVNKIEIDPKHRIYAYTTKGVYISDPIIVSVEDNLKSENSELNSSLIYPNPSTNSADIVFAIDEAEEIKIMIYDNSGRLIETLHSGLLESGEHTFSWNCSNVSSGKYICNISGNSVFKSLKLVVAR